MLDELSVTTCAGTMIVTGENYDIASVMVSDGRTVPSMFSGVNLITRKKR